MQHRFGVKSEAHLWGRVWDLVVFIVLSLACSAVVACYLMVAVLDALPCVVSILLRGRGRKPDTSHAELALERDPKRRGIIQRASGRSISEPGGRSIILHPIAKLIFRHVCDLGLAFVVNVQLFGTSL